MTLIQTLNEILEEAEKQEAKNESTRLENLKKEVEGIILNWYRSWAIY